MVVSRGFFSKAAQSIKEKAFDQFQELLNNKNCQVRNRRNFP